MAGIIEHGRPATWVIIVAAALVLLLVLLLVAARKPKRTRLAATAGKATVSRSQVRSAASGTQRSDTSQAGSYRPVQPYVPGIPPSAYTPPGVGTREAPSYPQAGAPAYRPLGAQPLGAQPLGAQPLGAQPLGAQPPAGKPPAGQVPSAPPLSAYPPPTGPPGVPARPTSLPGVSAQRAEAVQSIEAGDAAGGADAAAGAARAAGAAAAGEHQLAGSTSSLAGWYPVGGSPYELRYFDGGSWVARRRWDGAGWVEVD